MRNDSERQINISFGSPVVEPEVMRRPIALNARVVRDLGARADGIVEIDYGDGRITYYDRGISDDDIHLGHSALAHHLSEY